MNWPCDIANDEAKFNELKEFAKKQIDKLKLSKDEETLEKILEYLK